MKTDDAVSYYYVNGPSDVGFNQKWYDTCKSISNEISTKLLVDSNDPNHYLYPVRHWYTQEQADKYTVTELIVDHSYDSENNRIWYSCDEVQKMCNEVTGIDAVDAFNELKNNITKMSKFTIVYMINGTAQHFHGPVYVNGRQQKVDARTVTLVIPMNHVSPVTETLDLEYQEHDDDNLEMNLVKMFYSPYTIIQDHSNVLSIRLPSPGEYLVLDFNSTKCLHWVNAHNTNEYLCLVAEL